MAEHSRIEWTDATWNPITGCTLVSEGCRNCYAAELAAGRLRTLPSRQGLARRNADGIAAFTGEVRLNEEWLELPLHWRRPRRIFVCAHGDLFHESVPDDWIDRVFAVMQRAGRRHTFQVLTKRPERARDYLAALYPLGTADAQQWFDRGFVSPVAKPLVVPFRNVWLGVSAEDQATADARIPPLLETPAAVRFLSAEPLLGPIDLTRWSGLADCLDFGLDWVIVGGESGRRARPMHPDWARALRDQCRAGGVPFFFKQWGAWLPGEFGQPPLVEFQDGSSMDRHALPSDWDDEPNWDDGLSYIADGTSAHAIFVRAGKHRAGRLLDGREHSEMPG